MPLDLGLLSYKVLIKVQFMFLRWFVRKVCFVGSGLPPSGIK
jgi:hypothetical protein